VSEELKDASMLYERAVRIIMVALSECSHPSLKPCDHERNARAILVRLANADILLEAYEPESKCE
jgi:hypothetical protein